MRKILLILLFFMFVVIPIAAAQTVITLNSGKTIEGAIVEQTEEYVKINSLGVEMTFYLDEIATIEESQGEAASSDEPTPEEYRQATYQRFIESIQEGGMLEGIGTKIENLRTILNAVLAGETPSEEKIEEGINDLNTLELIIFDAGQ